MNPYRNLITKYEVLSSGILEHINNNTVILHFKNTSLTQHNVVQNDNSNVFSMLGGRNTVSNISNHTNQGGATGVYDASVTGTIPCRVYWQDAKFDKETNVINDKDYCKLRTFNQYADKLNNAVFAIIDGKRCNMIKPPKADGLGGNQWCNSWWEVVG